MNSQKIKKHSRLITCGSSFCDTIRKPCFTYGELISQNLGILFDDMSMPGCSNFDIFSQVKKYLKNIKIYDDNFMVLGNVISADRIPFREDTDVLLITFTDIHKISAYYHEPVGIPGAISRNAIIELYKLLEEHNVTYFFTTSHVDYRYMDLPLEIQDKFLLNNFDRSTLVDILYFTQKSNLSLPLPYDLSKYTKVSDFHDKMPPSNTNKFLSNDNKNEPSEQGHKFIAAQISHGIASKLDIDLAESYYNNNYNIYYNDDFNLNSSSDSDAKFSHYQDPFNIKKYIFRSNKYKRR